MRVRQSLINTWMRCALQAKFAYIDGLPQQTGSKQQFGSIIHMALEHYNRTGDLDMAIKLFVDAWDAPDKYGYPIDVWNRYTTHEGLRQRGIEILRNYVEKRRFEDRVVVAAEHRFLVPFGRHEIEGTVDLVEIRKNHRGGQILRVVDYKSSSHQPNLGSLLQNIQFTCYILATLQPQFWFGDGGEFKALPNAEWWWETLKDMPRRGIWYHLMSNKEIDAGARDQNDFERLYTVCDQIERAIEHQVFVPTLSGESCAFCSYANGPCPTKIPSREEWDALHQSGDDESGWT